MIGNTTNPLLKQTEEAIQAKVPKNMQEAFQRIVLAGSKVMYSKESQNLIADELKSDGDPAEIAGTGVAKLLGLLMAHSKGTMPMQAAIPAITVLLCEALDFMEQAGKVKVDADLLARATQDMASAVMQMMGLTPDKLSSIMQKSGQTPQTSPAPNTPTGIVAAGQGA